MLGRYLVSLSGHLSKVTLDEDGIPIYKVPYSNEYHHYPVDITQYALALFETGAFDRFLKQADWLRKNMNRDGIWEHRFKLPNYSFRIPWTHGMAQGMGISVLLRAYQHTKQRKYLDAAKKAYKPFKVPLEHKGIQYVEDATKYYWFEEYNVFPPPHILNGFIFALFGLYELYLVAKDEEVFDMFVRGRVTLENHLSEYDLGYWSKYNLVHDHPATEEYHMWHIEQLRAMYKITGIETFNKYADRWEKYANSTLNKIRVKIRRMKIHIKKHGIRNCITLWRKERKGGEINVGT